MTLCTRCVYPDNAKPMILFDLEGVCSGCQYRDSRESIDWKEQEAKLRDILRSAHSVQQRKGNPYDCVIPVSGGKDSHYQVYYVKEFLGFNPLLVTANHNFNTELGVKNLRNLVTQFGCDLVRFTISPKAARKIARWAMLEMGDLTFAYHAAIMCIPMRAAVQWDVPLVVWGEEGFSEQTGMFQLADEIEYTRWKTLQHDQRGYDREHLIGRGDGEWEITEADVEFMRYPTPNKIEDMGVRGIYLSNYLQWNAADHAAVMYHNYGFQFAGKRARTFLTYSKTDDHANDVHDYLKYLKFGYGRGTDDASTEIRAGRISREDGLELAQVLDPQYPAEWAWYLQWLQLDEAEVLERLQGMADGDVMERWEVSNTSAVVSNRVHEMLGLTHPYYTSHVLRTPRAMVTGKGGFEVL